MTSRAPLATAYAVDAVAVDAGFRAPQGPHADARLRVDARGCDGGIRKELAAGVRYGQTEGERAQIPDSNDGGFPDPHPGGWDHLVASGHQGIWLHRLSNRPKSH